MGSGGGGVANPHREGKELQHHHRGRLALPEPCALAVLVRTCG